MIHMPARYLKYLNDVVSFILLNFDNKIPNFISLESEIGDHIKIISLRGPFITLFKKNLKKIG